MPKEMSDWQLSTEPSEVYVRTVAGKDLSSVVGELLEKVKWQQLIPSGGFVVLKPNFCEYRSERISGANTSFQFIEAVCKVLSSRAGKIAIVESDGLRYQIDDVYLRMGLATLKKRYGVLLVNLTKGRTIVFQEPLLEGFGLPAIFNECDCFISLPKLKTHALTYFTGALKNQWGCIPRPDRILLHKHIHALIPRLNKILNPSFAVMDGIIAMEGRGPTNGIRRNLSLLLASRDLVALDATAMRLGGLEPRNARHVVEAASMGIGAIGEKEIRVDCDGIAPIVPFIPAKKEWTLNLMNYLTRYHPFVYHVLLNDSLFNRAKRLVTFLRKWRLS